MKKNKLTTEKLSLNKFKIASISNFGKRKIIGGTGVNDDDDHRTTKLTDILSTIDCKKKKDLDKELDG